MAAVLRDQDAIVADSAVSRHLDRRAADLLTDPHYPAWAAAMTEVIAGRDFPARRLREWTMLRALAVGGAWTAEDLTGASNWSQHMAATGRFAVPAEALGLLAEEGRTRRIRNAASRQLTGSGRTARTCTRTRTDHGSTG